MFACQLSIVVGGICSHLHSIMIVNDVIRESLHRESLADQEFNIYIYNDDDV